MKKGSILVIACIALLFLMPAAYLLVASLAGSWSYPDWFPTNLRFDAWQALLKGKAGLLDGFGHSMVLAVVTSIVCTASGFSLSRAVATHRFANRLMLLTYFPFVLSPVVYALLLQYFFIRVGLSGSLAGVMVAQYILILPFTLLLFYPFWTRRVSEMESVSYTLGGSFRFTLLHVLLPLAKPQIAVCFFQSFLISWFEFGLTSTVGLGKVQTLTLQVYQYVGEANIGFAAESSLLLVLPPLFLLLINKRFVFSNLD